MCGIISECARARSAKVIKSKLWNEQIFIRLSDCGRYIRMWYTHPRARMLPRHGVCVSREGYAEKRVYTAIREYYCGAGRSATGEREIYQRVGVYVATNCRVNIHVIRSWPSPPFILLLLYPRSEHASTTSRILDFNPNLPLLSLRKLVASSQQLLCVYSLMWNIFNMLIYI